LSLYHILDLAVQELIIVGERQLLFMSTNGDLAWHIHVSHLEAIVKRYSDLSKDLEDVLRFASNMSSTIISTFLNIKYPFRFVDCTRSSTKGQTTIDYYAKKKHYGIAYILQMRQLEHEEIPDDDTVHEFLENRDSFINQLGPVLARHDVSPSFCIEGLAYLQLRLIETQLFVPRNLLRIPALAMSIKNDGRRDLLGRFASHILYDAKVDQNSTFDVRMDDCDVIGRSTLHIACSMTSQERQMRQVDLTSNVWPGFNMLGLNVLHIAAARGDIEVFRMIAEYNHEFSAGLFPAVLSGFRSSATIRTYLHWAARYGNSAVVDFLVEYLEVNSHVLYARDHQGDAALNLAAEFGHFKVVQSLLPVTRFHDLVGFSLFKRTPFFSAATGGQLKIMELLAPSGDVDKECENEFGKSLSPLAEVARRGFLGCVEYLLKHEQVDINSVHDQKTPIDHAMAGGHEPCAKLMRYYGAKTFEELLNDSDSDPSTEDSD
jgi:ankyrin repeat protein